MSRSTPAIALLALLACDNARSQPPHAGIEPCEDATPQLAAFERPAGELMLPACDSARCITAALAEAQSSGAGGVGLQRGATYTLDATVWVPRGLMLAAVGDTARPRPVLSAPEPLGPYGAVVLGDSAAFISLDLRGPHYGQTGYPVAVMGDWDFKGVNGGDGKHWTVADSNIDGFAGTGVLGVIADGARVLNSRLAHNGFSGISIFAPSEHSESCGADVVIAGNVMEHNGQNGIDICSSRTVIEGNVARWNGWDGRGGDQNGLLHYSTNVVSVRDVRIRNNLTCEGHGHGIRLHGHDVEGVSIVDNRVGDGIMAEPSRPGGFRNVVVQP